MIGVDYPIKKSQSDGYFKQTKTSNDKVLSHIKLLFSTVKDEIVNRPNYGMSLRMYLFEPLSELLYDKIKEEIHSQWNLWIDAVLEDIIIEPDEDNNIISIQIKFKYNESDEISETFDVSLGN